MEIRDISKLKLDRSGLEEIEGLLSGIRCGFKNTSCADQLAKAVRTAYEEEKDEHGSSIQ